MLAKETRKDDASRSRGSPGGSGPGSRRDRIAKRSIPLKIKVWTVIVAASCLLLIVFGVLLIGKDDPAPEAVGDVELRVHSYYNTTVIDNTTFMDTGSIEVLIVNIGKVYAEGGRISLSISGNNVLEKEIAWTGGDIPKGKSASAFITVETDKPGRYFDVLIMVRYDGGYECHDRIP